MPVKRELIKQLDLSFPFAGMDQTTPFSRQRQRLVSEGVYGRSTIRGVNVLAYESVAGRMRGASRPGISKYIATQPGGSAATIQELVMVAGAGYTAPGGSAQANQSGRIVTLVAVVGGLVYVADAGGSSWTLATNGSSLTQYLSATGVVRSTVLNQKVYLTDGTLRCYYDPSDNTVKNWEPQEGSFPSSGGSIPKILCTYRGRLCMALNNILYMSKQGDATKWQFSPTTVTSTQAVAGSASNLGMTGDFITGLAPFNDDVLVVFGDSSIWQLKGDPMSGGQFQRFTDAIGGAFGVPWSKDPQGGLYFMSNRGDIYTMMPGQQPQIISDKIRPSLSQINTGTHLVRLVWNDTLVGLHVFITTAAEAAAETHWFWEGRTGSWWQWSFANNNHNPIVTTTFDGNSPSDRVNLIGSWDGYVRTLGASATTDDGTNIASEVWLGPLTSDTMDALMLHNIQADMGEDSGTVTYSVHVGKTAEAAYNSVAVMSGTWGSSRNRVNHIRRAAHALYIKLTSSSQWAMERVRCEIEALGDPRRRRVY